MAEHPKLFFPKVEAQSVQGAVVRVSVAGLMGGGEPDYIPIRIQVPTSVDPGVPFSVTLGFRDVDPGQYSAVANVQMDFAIDGDGILVDLPETPEAVLVTVDSLLEGTVTCKLPSDSPEGTLQITVTGVVGAEQGQVYASLPVNPLS